MILLDKESPNSQLQGGSGPKKMVKNCQKIEYICPKIKNSLKGQLDRIKGSQSPVGNDEISDSTN